MMKLIDMLLEKRYFADDWSSVSGSKVVAVKLQKRTSPGDVAELYVDLVRYGVIPVIYR